MSQNKENRQDNHVVDGKTERSWRDFFIFPALMSWIIILFGEVLGGIIFFPLALIEHNNPLLKTLHFYMDYFGIWIVLYLYLYLVKRDRPILKMLGPKAKGNTLPFLALGAMVGFTMNTFCILIAHLHGDIKLSFDSFHLLPLICILAAVFVQSSAEEFVFRGYLYQRLRKGYDHPLVAIIGNALVFFSIHIANPKVNVWAVIVLAATGIFFSVVIYYFDSIWFCCAAHTMWNFTQNIIFGLPNSGIVSQYSIFKLEKGAKSSLVYDTGFGVEGAIVAILVYGIASVFLWQFGKRRGFTSENIWETV